MEYTITSSKKVCGKVKGEKLTATDIIGAGGSVEHLLAAGHIKESTKTPKAAQEVKEVQQEPQEPQFPVFNLDNEQGEK
jgi:hypothetical protein